mgnify:CR=1 FL=1
MHYKRHYVAVTFTSPGRYQNATGQDTCIDCPEGEYCRYV